jgi:hypothetical protein
MANKKFKDLVDAQSGLKISSQTASTVPYLDASKNLTSSAVTPTELGYLSGATSNIQTQIGDHLTDSSDAHDASAISSVAAGNLAATNVQSALDELQSDVDSRALASDLSNHLSDASDAHDASAISSVASGNLAATDVQGALNELQSDIDSRALDSAVIKKNGSVAFTADQSMGGFKLTNVATPVSGTDAANKAYVDGAAGTLGEWQNSALDYIVDNTLAPPTEVSGDRYILSHDGGTPHANYDGADAGDIVEFNGSVWVETNPAVGFFISANDEPNRLYYWGGASWEPKNFESSTASTGLTKVGFDIRLADAAENASGIKVLSGAITLEDLGAFDTADLAEGTNLYHTDERAQDAVGSILVDSSSIDFTYNDGTPSITGAVIPGGVDHDALSNFVANEHIDHSSVSINTAANSGLSGGGNITASRSLVIDPSNAPSVSAASADSVLISDASDSGALKKVTVQSIVDLAGAGSAGDIAETSFSIANNQATPANVTGLAFANATVRGFEVLASVEIDAAADLFETFALYGIQKGAGWDMSQESVGDDSGIIFSITSAGVVQYISQSYPGFVSGAIKFRARTTSF